MSEEMEQYEYERKKDLYDHYREQQNVVASCAMEISGRATKVALALSGGALTFSIGFLQNIVNSPKPEFIWVLGLSWSFLIGSLGMLLWCQLTSQKGLEAEGAWLSERLHALDESGGFKNPFKRVINRQRNAGLSLSLLGIICLGVFAFININPSYFDVEKHPQETLSLVEPHASEEAGGEINKLQCGVLQRVPASPAP